MYNLDIRFNSFLYLADIVKIRQNVSVSIPRQNDVQAIRIYTFLIIGKALLIYPNKSQEGKLAFDWRLSSLCVDRTNVLSTKYALFSVIFK